MSLLDTTIHPSWEPFLTEEVKGVIRQIDQKLQGTEYYPKEENVLRFLKTDADRLKCVIVGMDPYPSWNDRDNIPVATGRSFEVSTLRNAEDGWHHSFRQSSLKNMVKAVYYNETGTQISWKDLLEKLGEEPSLFNGNFSLASPKDWFDGLEAQGVLFLNATLTVSPGKPGSHAALWEPFRKKLVPCLGKKGLSWMLWGNHAQEEFGSLLPKRREHRQGTAPTHGWLCAGKPIPVCPGHRLDSRKVKIISNKQG